jgi:hypothetical protein
MYVLLDLIFLIKRENILFLYPSSCRYVLFNKKNLNILANALLACLFYIVKACIKTHCIKL